MPDVVYHGRPERAPAVFLRCLFGENKQFYIEVKQEGNEEEDEGNVGDVAVQIGYNEGIDGKFMDGERNKTGGIGIPVTLGIEGQRQLPERFGSFVGIAGGKSVNGMQITGTGDQKSSEKTGKDKFNSAGAFFQAVFESGYFERTEEVEKVAAQRE